MATPDLCASCFEVLDARFSNRPARDPVKVRELWIEHESGDSKKSRGENAATSSVNIEEKYPLFVTWDIRSDQDDHELRGCIGTFEAQALTEAIPEYAAIAAFQDNRFNPISPEELPDLICSVTLLTDFEDCKDPLDWELGTHGIRIKFGGHYGSTFLPSVATEQGWTKIVTLRHLVRKAGFRGGSGRSENKLDEADQKWFRLLEEGSVVRYQGKKATLGYDEWKQWNDWTTSQK